jgi:uncharacterized protein
MKRKFIGRKQELQKLEALLAKNTTNLVVIKGRRRIGKSRLVEEFSKNRRFYNLQQISYRISINSR